MMKRLFGAELGLHTGLWAALAGAALCVLPPAAAQESLVSAPEPSHPARPQMLTGRLPEKPSQSPAFQVPVGPLGFSAPGAFYLGQRTSLVSLDFLDEDRLLFTFRVPGLMRRDAGDDEERQIRAVVLKLPGGAVEAEAVWRVHDRAHYLRMLKDGHFLLRDGSDLDVGDASLELRPFLRFPGPLLSLETDPTQQFLVTDSREPVVAAGKTGAAPGPEGAGKTAEAEKPADVPDLAVRILRRDSGAVVLVSRTRTPVHLPINGDGYLESLRSRGNEWLLNLNYFSGGSSILGQIDSACPPLFDFLSEREVLATGCAASGAGNLVAMGTDGRRLWEAQSSETTVWPLLVKAPDGLRLARETLVVSTPVDALAPLDSEEIKGQLVEVLDAADGKIALETTASPVLDAGGNVAISPSGRRVAVLNGGQIQVFELPPAPPLREPAAHPAAR